MSFSLVQLFPDKVPLTDAFPDPRQADSDGLVAVGGDFQADFLLAAYVRGVFPWPMEDLPDGWFCPDPRTVLVPGTMHVSRSLRRTLGTGRYRTTFDVAFDEVIDACARQNRPGQGGTWITDELADGFRTLHEAGFAHSCETWRDDELVGGIYGLSLGAMFCGESMFYRESNASKVALHALLTRLERWGFAFLDCQITTPHLKRLGAVEWSRDRFLDAVAEAVAEPTRLGPWTDV
ncbi:MAG: leucyl/phenylalanyl-tRNA--protein transferase [Thermoanaerobaculia bacterium]|nr:leucyl/phenylalanyl-tRNA--protein transferase [Thermoanaerobaculia bacterium]